MNPAHEDIALCLIDWVANGLPVTFDENDYQHTRFVHWIALSAGTFFDKYPHLLTDDVLESLATDSQAAALTAYEKSGELVTLRKVLSRYKLSLLQTA